jgi:hypothetical protein
LNLQKQQSIKFICGDVLAAEYRILLYGLNKILYFRGNFKVVVSKVEKATGSFLSLIIIF